MREDKLVNYNYNSIKYFLSVAKRKSISKAATSLGISQSALSQSMKDLEYSLGVKLFTRNTRGIVLTKEGQTMYENAIIGDNYIEKAIIDSIRVNRYDTLKTFRVSISSSLFRIIMSPIMKDIVKKYPDVNFEFYSSTLDADVAKKILNCEMDLIIFKTDEAFKLKEVVCERLTELNYCLSYNPEYYDFKAEVSLEDLKDVPIIRKKRDGRNDNSWILTNFKQIITCKNDNGILELIKNGAGIGFYPIELVEKENLKTIKSLEFVPVKRTVEACYLESNAIAEDIVNTFNSIFKQDIS